MLFRSTKSMDFNFKIKLNGNGLYETNSVKYTGIRIDNKLYWKFHIDNIALKLIRTNAILYKVKDFVNFRISKAIYYALFVSHIRYTCIVWGQNVCTINYFLHFKGKHYVWFVLKNIRPILLLSFSKQKRWNFLIKLKFKIAFWSAVMSITNYLPSLIARLSFSPILITMKPHL